MTKPVFDGAHTCVRRAWRAHAGELRNYLTHRLADRSMADDLVQEVFLRAIRQRQGFCELDNSRAWLFQVARNALIDRARLHHDEAPLPEELVDDVEERPPVEALAESLGDVLAALPEVDADILRRCDIEGLRQSDYAALSGLNLSAVKSRLLRARQRLREQLVARYRVRFDASGKVCCHRGASTN